MIRHKSQSPWRFAHLGIEFAGSALMLGLVGWYFDRRYGTRPWGVVIGFAIGFVGATYLFIKKALQANQAGPPPRRSQPSPPDQPPIDNRRQDHDHDP